MRAGWRRPRPFVYKPSRVQHVQQELNIILASYTTVHNVQITSYPCICKAVNVDDALTERMHHV